jgi:TetR/AcrR family transcriptional regulator
MPAAKRAPKPRRPGRPLAGADLRERLLDAAIACFSEHGIAATTLRAIATSAGVTPALLHYYFQTKGKLVQVVLDERIAPFVAASAAPLLKPLPSPRATLRAFLETHMRNLAANPWMPRLMAREVLSEGGSLRGHMQAQFSAVLSPKTFMLIISAQQRGEIRNDLNPMLIGLSLISLAVFPFAAAPVWHEVAKSYARGAPELESRIAHMRREAAQSSAWARPDHEALIAHTLALFDSALEKPHAAPKR